LIGWLLVLLRVVGAVMVVFLGIGVKFSQPSSQWEAIPEEIYQTLLTNKKQGNLN
jgi:hypothetical protein